MILIRPRAEQEFKAQNVDDNILCKLLGGFMNYIKLKKLCDVFISRPSIRKESDENAYLITPSNLYDNNVIMGLEKASISKSTNSKYMLQTGDILIKRLNPVFVNLFSQIDSPAYSSSNIIVVRPRRKDSSDYIAAILGIYGVESMTHYVKKGVTIQALSAKELLELSIPIVPIDKQQKIGALWKLYQRKRILQNKLNETESLYISNALKTILNEEK